MSHIEFSWDVLPSTRLEQSQIVVPPGVIITPFKELCELLPHDRILTCSTCHAIFNHLVKFDRQNHRWWCPLCSELTLLPSEFVIPRKDTAVDDLPAELRQTKSETIEYILPHDISRGTSGESQDYIVTLVLDNYQHIDSLDLEEFNALITQLCSVMDLVPPHAKVLVITVDESIHVHGISGTITLLQKSLVSDAYNYFDIFKDISLRSQIVEICRPHTATLFWDDLELLKTYLKTLRPRITREYKADRATGFALLATSVILKTFGSKAGFGNVHLFLNGPPTMEPGKVVAPSEHIRGFSDIELLKAPHYRNAIQYYQGISHIAAGYSFDAGHAASQKSATVITSHEVDAKSFKFSIDLYSGSVDQVGLAEMIDMAKGSGGGALIAESFTSLYFSQALQLKFKSIANEHQLCQLSVHTSEGIRIQRFLSSGTPLSKRDQDNTELSDLVTRFDSSMTKQITTNRWYLGKVLPEQAFGIMLEMKTAKSSAALDPIKGFREAFLQVQVEYWNAATKTRRVRVITTGRPTTLGVMAKHQRRLKNGKNLLVNKVSTIAKEKALLESFNHETWLALFTRLLILNNDVGNRSEFITTVELHIQHTLIRLLKQFGGVKVGSTTANPLDFSSTYVLAENFKLLPEYAYNLCRNPQLLRIGNCSPDEIACHHLLFQGLSSHNSCVMIHPRLYEYKDNSLSLLSLARDQLVALKRRCFIVLDMFSTVIVYHHYINEEDKLPLHDSNNESIEYLEQSAGAFHQCLEEIRNHLIKGRPITPKIVATQTGHSQARFLLSRLPTECTSQPKPEPEKRSIFSWFTKETGQAEVGIHEMSESQFYDFITGEAQALRAEES